MITDLLSEYTRFTELTCVNSSWEALYYGLLGEVGELAEIYKRNYRGDRDCGFHIFDIHYEIVRECGDVLWYLCNLNLNYGTQDLIFNSEVKANICLFDFPRILSEINNARVFDDGMKISYWCSKGVELIQKTAKYHDSNLVQVILINQEKLKKRLEENRLMGKGGDR